MIYINLHNPFHTVFFWRATFLLACLTSSLSATNSYFAHNLASDLPGTADQLDVELVNPWDFVAFNVCMPVGFPSCAPPDVSSVLIANQGTGMIAQYTPIPGVVESRSYPYQARDVTGVMGNIGLSQSGTTALSSGTLFCTGDGKIVGLSVFSPTFITTLVDNSKSGSVYKGCTCGNLIQQKGQPFYYAANFASGKIDVWDSNLNPLENAGMFVNPVIPAGFVPFNVQAISDKVLLVTYAQRDPAEQNDVPGVGHGYIAAFDFNGNFLNTLVARGPLNSPWGISIAPATFGEFANALLVGNSGDGRVNAFDPVTGAWKGSLADLKGNPITIQGLHALHFGGGGPSGDPSTLYFTAGIGGPNEPLGSHGLFGSIQAAPFFQATAVVNGAELSAANPFKFSGAIAPNTWATVTGGSLSAIVRSWNSADITGNHLPTELDGVGVTLNGEAAFVSYVSPTQINFLIPADLVPGPVEIRTSNNGLVSAPVATTLAVAAPAFFYVPGEDEGENFVAALHSDNTPAFVVTPGETIALYGTGFGATVPAIPNGKLVGSPLRLKEQVQVTIGDQPAEVTFAGLVAPGLYQLNVIVPSIDPKYHLFGAPVTASINGVATQASGYLGF